MAGKIQNEDIKSVAELVAAGATAASLPNDDKIWVTANGINRTLKQAIIDDVFGGGSTTLGIVRFQVNGQYNLQGALSAPDGHFYFNEAVRILAVRCYVQIAGSGGSTTFRLMYKPPAGSFATMFSTNAAIAAAAGSNADIKTGDVKANMTAPVMTATPFLVAAGGAISLDITGVQSGAPNTCGCFVYFEKQ
jgi:hypothetical protein